MQFKKFLTHVKALFWNDRIKSNICYKISFENQFYAKNINVVKSLIILDFIFIHKYITNIYSRWFLASFFPSGNHITPFIIWSLVSHPNTHTYIRILKLNVMKRRMSIIYRLHLCDIFFPGFCKIFILLKVTKVLALVFYALYNK